MPLHRPSQRSRSKEGRRLPRYTEGTSGARSRGRDRSERRLEPQARAVFPDGGARGVDLEPPGRRPPLGGSPGDTARLPGRGRKPGAAGSRPGRAPPDARQLSAYRRLAPGTPSRAADRTGAHRPPRRLRHLAGVASGNESLGLCPMAPFAADRAARSSRAAGGRFARGAGLLGGRFAPTPAGRPAPDRRRRGW